VGRICRLRALRATVFDRSAAGLRRVVTGGDLGPVRSRWRPRSRSRSGPPRSLSWPRSRPLPWLRPLRAASAERQRRRHATRRSGTPSGQDLSGAGALCDGVRPVGGVRRRVVTGRDLGPVPSQSRSRSRSRSRPRPSPRPLAWSGLAWPWLGRPRSWRGLARARAAPAVSADGTQPAVQVRRVGRTCRLRALSATLFDRSAAGLRRVVTGGGPAGRCGAAASRGPASPPAAAWRHVSGPARASRPSAARSGRDDPRPRRSEESAVPSGRDEAPSGEPDGASGRSQRAGYWPRLTCGFGRRRNRSCHERVRM
jgi:hypothetical protein